MKPRLTPNSETQKCVRISEPALYSPSAHGSPRRAAAQNSRFSRLRLLGIYLSASSELKEMWGCRAGFSMIWARRCASRCCGYCGNRKTAYPGGRRLLSLSHSTLWNIDELETNLSRHAFCMAVRPRSGLKLRSNKIFYKSRLA